MRGGNVSQIRVLFFVDVGEAEGLCEGDEQ